MTIPFNKIYQGNLDLKIKKSNTCNRNLYDISENYNSCETSKLENFNSFNTNDKEFILNKKYSLFSSWKKLFNKNDVINNNNQYDEDATHELYDNNNIFKTKSLKANLLDLKFNKSSNINSILENSNLKPNKHKSYLITNRHNKSMNTNCSNIYSDRTYRKIKAKCFKYKKRLNLYNINYNTNFIIDSKSNLIQHMDTENNLNASDNNKSVSYNSNTDNSNYYNDNSNLYSFSGIRNSNCELVDKSTISLLYDNKNDNIEAKDILNKFNYDDKSFMDIINKNTLFNKYFEIYNNINIQLNNNSKLEKLSVIPYLTLFDRNILRYSIPDAQLINFNFKCRNNLNIDNNILKYNLYYVDYFYKGLLSLHYLDYNSSYNYFKQSLQLLKDIINKGNKIIYIDKNLKFITNINNNENISININSLEYDAIIIKKFYILSLFNLIFSNNIKDNCINLINFENTILQYETTKYYEKNNLFKFNFCINNRKDELTNNKLNEYVEYIKDIIYHSNDLKNTLDLLDKDNNTATDKIDIL